MPLPSERQLLSELVAAPGPPGEEDAIRAVVARHLDSLGLPHRTDAKGNLLTWLGGDEPERPEVVVTAHLDEIALMVTGADGDGALTVSALGGAHAWKWGEGPVEILAREATVPGVLSFGSIHTTNPAAVAAQAKEGKAVGWGAARIITGLDVRGLREKGIRPGTRVALARERRRIWDLAGGLIASYFLDDRADLLAWLMTLSELAGGDDRAAHDNILFAATASEEVGGEGALYLLHEIRPAICIALEIGPTTPDAPFPVDASPTLWVSDSFAVMAAADIGLVEAAAEAAGTGLHYQAVTRGGSDASCAASHGLCARPITLAFAAENSHGFEIMHRDAPGNLAKLLLACLNLLTN